MRFIIAFSATLSACLGLFFALHHKREEFKACTLAKIYADFFRNAPRLFRIGSVLILSIGGSGLVAAFYPALLLVLARWVAGGEWFVLGGLLAIVGTAANLFVMLLSQASFGWGASSYPRTETI